MLHSMLQPFSHARVLIVDDNLPSVSLMRSLLTRSGLQAVHSVTDSRQALDVVATLDPQLVLLDLHMPGVDGYTLLAAMRERATAADLPVLVLTADTSRDASLRALSLGANDFLTKPLDTTEVVLRVRNLLETRSLHDGLRQRQRWLEASGRIARELLSGEREHPLQMIAELALELAHADLVVTSVPAAGLAEPRMMVAAAGAFESMQLQPIAERIGVELAGPVILSGTPLVLPTGPAPDGDEPCCPEIGAVMVLPLLGKHSVRGALSLCRHRDHPGFTDLDLDMATGFATQAATALELADARLDQERITVLEDRHRIARDLHDHVIQRLFATGLRMEQLAVQAGPGEVADRIQDRCSDLDDTISEIRARIFQLRSPSAVTPDVLRSRLGHLVDEVADALGFQPVLHFSGIKEPAIADDIAQDLLAAAREGLTNVARHAKASAVNLDVALTGDRLSLTIVDDGVGIGDAGRRSGLDNLAERAEEYGGYCTVVSPSAGGTRLMWTVPIVA